MSNREVVYIMPKEPIMAEVIRDSNGDVIEYANIGLIWANEVENRVFFFKESWEEVSKP